MPVPTNNNSRSSNSASAKGGASGGGSGDNDIYRIIKGNCEELVDLLDANIHDPSFINSLYPCEEISKKLKLVSHKPETYSILHLASVVGNLKMVSLLLDRGADIESRTSGLKL